MLIQQSMTSDDHPSIATEIISPGGGSPETSRRGEVGRCGAPGGGRPGEGDLHCWRSSAAPTGAQGCEWMLQQIEMPVPSGAQMVCTSPLLAAS